jgi:CO/xanthine dehydrogenase FAD-binding subunit
VTEYVFAESIEETLARLAQYQGTARIVAGGTDLTLDIRNHRFSPACLVDVTRIPGLDRIEVQGDLVRVGAAVTFADLRQSEFVQRRLPALARAAASVGATAIQNSATWVGNIVQAMPAADGAIVALALEAEANIVNSHGDTWRDVRSLFVGPGKSAIDPGSEMMTFLRFKLPDGPSGLAWGRIGRRDSLVLPILNCAVRVCLANDTSRIERATIAIGPVAPTPFLASTAEEYLVGRLPKESVLHRAAEIARDESNPRTSPSRASREYRLSILPAMVKDCLSRACLEARFREPRQLPGAPELYKEDRSSVLFEGAP